MSTSDITPKYPKMLGPELVRPMEIPPREERQRCGECGGRGYVMVQRMVTVISAATARLPRRRRKYVRIPDPKPVTCEAPGCEGKGWRHVPLAGKARDAA